MNNGRAKQSLAVGFILLFVAVDILKELESKK
jgi:hypothetical protein